MRVSCRFPNTPGTPIARYGQGNSPVAQETVGNTVLNRSQQGCGSRAATALRVAFPLGIVCFATACLDKTPVDPAFYEHLSIVEDSLVLSERVTYIDQTPLAIVPVAGSGGGKAAFGAAVTFRLQAQVAPPEVGGTRLQASHVVRHGGRAYVAYNVRGDAFRGGVDAFDKLESSKPVLTSQVVFYDTDVSAIDQAGGDLYLATATANEAFANPAVLELLHLKGGGKQVAESTARIPLSSFAATGVRVDGGLTYVTTGSDGGLTIFDQDFNAIFTDAVADARAVAVTGDYIVVMRGTPGMLRVYDEGSRARIHDIDLGGASIPQSKGSLFVVNDLAFVATGDGGVVVVDLVAGVVIEQLPAPSVAGLPADLTVSNGLAWHRDLLFIANGEAGLWVAQASDRLDQLQGPPGLTVLGRVDLGGSANYVEVKGDRLFVASGLSGLSIIEVND